MTVSIIDHISQYTSSILTCRKLGSDHVIAVSIISFLFLLLTSTTNTITINNNTHHLHCFHLLYPSSPLSPSLPTSLSLLADPYNKRASINRPVLRLQVIIIPITHNMIQHTCYVHYNIAPLSHII